MVRAQNTNGIRLTINNFNYEAARKLFQQPLFLYESCYDIDDPQLAKVDRLAIILGSEGPGLRENTITQSDFTIKIPMATGVDSLNVAAASALAFWELGNRKVK